MESTSKWKEEREVVTCISLSLFKYNSYTLSVSLLMARTKEEEQQQLQLLTKQQNTTLFSGYLLSSDPRGYL